MIIPSIDLMGGKAVQLRQGSEKVLERADVLALAREFSKYGELVVIDLDAAFGRGDNLALVKQLCREFDCRVGGGIRTAERANEILRAGARKIIIGTKAEPEFLRLFPKERLVVAIDSKDGYVVNEGWTKKTGRAPEKVVKELEPYCSEFLFTNVNFEGLMKGFDMGAVKRLKEATKNKLTVAGGITKVSEIKELEELGVNSQLGMALYTNRIKLDEAFISVLEFNDSLLPTIVQDENSQVLMLAFSSRQSLSKTFKTNKATYYSRSRKRLWTKGETSGNCQQFIKARYDCDRDALLFTVRQRNVACHTGSYSCFGGREFSFEELYDVVLDRVARPREGSYTSRIASDERAVLEKIKEEVEEVLEYKDRDNLVWEIADLIYFLTILMAKKGVSFKDIKNELYGRRR